MIARASILLPILLIALATTARAESDEPPWLDSVDTKVVEVITLDEDGDVRKSKVWYVVIDGEVYLRTSRSKWLKNLRRDPNLLVRVNKREIPAHSEEVTSDELIEKVDAATREKYGFQERLIHIFRLRKPDILKLTRR